MGAARRGDPDHCRRREADRGRLPTAQCFLPPGKDEAASSRVWADCACWSPSRHSLESELCICTGYIMWGAQDKMPVRRVWCKKC